MRKRKSNIIDIDEVEKIYTIMEDGRVWNKVRGKWIKPQGNVYRYIYYHISKGVGTHMTVFAHTLVALKYIGKPLTPRHEIDHIDNDRSNNHYTNLQWVTHSMNQLKAYAQGRTNYWVGKIRGTPSIITRMKMANAKKKRIRYILNGVRTTYDSIQDAAIGIGISRQMISLYLKNNRPCRGGCLVVIKDKF